MLSKLKNIFRESFIYSTGSVVVKLSGFLMMSLYTSYTTVDEFGLIMLFEVVYQFLQSISGWGLKGGFQRWYYDMQSDRDKKSLFFTSYFSTTLTTLLAVTSLFFVLNVFAFEIFQYQVSAKVILLFSASAFLRLLLDMPFTLLRLQQKAANQTFYQTLSIVLTLVITYIALHFLKLGLEGVYWGQFVANASTLLFVVPVIVRNSYLKILKKTIPEMMSFGAPLVLSNVLTIILSLSDRFIIRYFSTLGDVGSFSMAFKIATIVQFVIVAPFLTSYSFDYYRHMNDTSRNQYYVKFFTYFVFFMSVVGIGIVLFSKEAIFLLATGNATYYEAIPLIPIMIVGIIFSGMRMVFALPLQKAKKTRKISLILISAGVINLLLNLLIIPFWGKAGAAVTTLISQLVAAVWFYQVIKKEEDETYELLKIGKVIFLASLVMYGYIALPNLYWVVDYVVKILTIPLFILLLYWFRCLDSNELKRGFYIFKKWKNPSRWHSNIKELQNSDGDDE